MFILQSSLLSLLRLLFLSSLVWTTVFAAEEKSGCSHSCGDIPIPYPFGIEEGCFLKEDFRIICDTSSNPPKPFLKIKVGFSNQHTREVVNISLSPPSITLNNWVASSCNISTNFVHPERAGFVVLNTSFTLSYTQNKFTAIGCAAAGVMSTNINTSTFCSSTCANEMDLADGVCSGIGCCQIGIPKGLKLFAVVILNDTTGTSNPWKSGTCNYAFVVQENKYTFKASDIVGFNFLKRSGSVPFVLDWTIGNQTCEEAKGLSTYACQTNSTCIDSDNGPGHYCTCLKGYEGNPYLIPGCLDINECEGSSRCGNGTCVNTPGSYKCICPEGTQGNGISCYPVSHTPVIQIALGVGFGLLALLIGISLVYFGFKKQKLMKQKEKFFKENGGLLLQQQIGLHGGAMESQKIFSLEELEKATKKFSESCIISRGGNGTVYKGTLLDNRIIAIKKPRTIEKTHIEQFINEIVILTQINHRNVVKLLGCCLETEVPLLAYEFISNGTLFEHLHCNRGTNFLSWNDRLRIATESASAFSYLHSAASMPIIHRDIKSSNILLDDQCIAKVSDFGASKFIPIDKNQLTTQVLGTRGYLDPEYLHTGQLTEKSDVYSFGVVLAELLTGLTAISFERLKEERNLASYFVHSMRQNCLFEILVDRLVNNENLEEVTRVAELTKRCLKSIGEERPSMREVLAELEGLRKSFRQPRASTNTDELEEQVGDLYPNSADSSLIFP